MWMGGGGEPTPETIAASNSAFFQILDVADRLLVSSVLPSKSPGVLLRSSMKESLEPA